MVSEKGVPDDLYAILGVAASASKDEIKKAYRGIARKYHPDKNPGDTVAERVFKQAVEAYRVLGDVELRAQYDAQRKPQGAPPKQDAGTENPGDLFNEIFGTRSRTGDHGTGRARGHGQHNPPRPSNPPPGPRPTAGPSTRREGPPTAADARPTGRPRARDQGPERGDDLRYVLEIDLADTLKTTSHPINVPRRARCRRCVGTGSKPGSLPARCDACQGLGTVRQQQGFFSTAKTCHRCGGMGRVILDPCEECSGTGEVRVARTIVVDVPAGIESGARLKLANEGELGRGGGPPGDLYVVVQVRPHPFLDRDGPDLLGEVPVRFMEAAMGATIDVPTLEGLVRMKVPPGSQPGRVFRLKGKGLIDAERQVRGDQRVRVVVEVPEFLSKEQRELLEQYDELEDQHDENPIVRDYRRRLSRWAKEQE